MPNITLKAYENLLGRSQLYAADFLDDLTANHEGYTHTIAAIGGYLQANFTLKGTYGYLKDWYNDGILRRIATYNPEGNMIWEGYVHRLKLNSGIRQLTKSVESYYNRVYMKYSPLDFSTFPPTSSPPTTLIIDNVEGRLTYGTKAVIVNGGERVDNTAFEWANTILKYRSNKIPEGGVQSTGRSSNSYLEVECKGYWHTLSWLPYINLNPGSVQAHQVIQEVLEYFNDINSGWFSLDFSEIQYNFRREKRLSDSLATCQERIVDVMKNGGAGGERWVGGVYQDRQFIFKPAEDLQGLYGIEDRIVNSLEDPTQKYYNEANKTEIKPWDMVPDRILKTIDIK